MGASGNEMDAVKGGRAAVHLWGLSDPFVLLTISIPVVG
jgi:hypothetical protein